MQTRAPFCFCWLNFLCTFVIRVFCREECMMPLLLHEWSWKFCLLHGSGKREDWLSMRSGRSVIEFFMIINADKNLDESCWQGNIEINLDEDCWVTNHRDKILEGDRWWDYYCQWKLRGRLWLDRIFKHVWLTITSKSVCMAEQLAIDSLGYYCKDARMLGLSALDAAWCAGMNFACPSHRTL